MTENFTERLALKFFDNEKVDTNELFNIFSNFVDSKTLIVQQVIHKEEQIYIINLKNALEAKKVYEECDGVTIEGANISFDFYVVPTEAIFDQIVLEKSLLEK